jgi:hypothetical protein
MTALATTPTMPGTDTDPFSREFFNNPYPAYVYLRDAGPVLWFRKYGIYGMARHKNVIGALHDPATFISGAGAGIHDLRKRNAWRLPSIVLEADPPLHDTTRGALNRILSGPAIRKLRTPFEAEAERLADELVARGHFDAVADFAIPYPLKVVGDAIGVPPEGRECLLPYGNMLFNSFGPENDIFLTSIAEGKTVVEELTRQCQRGSLTPGGFGEQLFEQADAGRITQEQAPILVRSLLSAGFDTTVNGLSSAIYAFATNPDQWELLRRKPALQRTAFEEVLRWESPAQTFFRTTSRDVEIEGAKIPKDEKVLLFLGAANRDPRQWQDPDKFDIERNTHGHVALGSGIHVCVGQMLARLEAELLFAAFAKRVAGFEIDGEPVRRMNNTLRGFASLPVRVKRLN